MVAACARQYRGSPEPAEDLMQVGYVGLLKAINNFDPAYGDKPAQIAARAGHSTHVLLTVYVHRIHDHDQQLNQHNTTALTPYPPAYPPGLEEANRSPARPPRRPLRETALLDYSPKTVVMRLASPVWRACNSMVRLLREPYLAGTPICAQRRRSWPSRNWRRQTPWYQPSRRPALKGSVRR